MRPRTRWGLDAAMHTWESGAKTLQSLWEELVPSRADVNQRKKTRGDDGVLGSRRRQGWGRLPRRRCPLSHPRGTHVASAFRDQRQRHCVHGILQTRSGAPISPPPSPSALHPEMQSPQSRRGHHVSSRREDPSRPPMVWTLCPRRSLGGEAGPGGLERGPAGRPWRGRRMCFRLCQPCPFGGNCSALLLQQEGGR